MHIFWYNLTWTTSRTVRNTFLLCTVFWSLAFYSSKAMNIALHVYIATDCANGTPCCPADLPEKSRNWVEGSCWGGLDSWSTWTIKEALLNHKGEHTRASRTLQGLLLYCCLLCFKRKHTMLDHIPNTVGCRFSRGGGSPSKVTLSMWRPVRTVRSLKLYYQQGLML